MDGDEKPDGNPSATSVRPPVTSSSGIKSEFLDDLPLDTRLELSRGDDRREDDEAFVKNEEDVADVDSDAVINILIIIQLLLAF
jgi:hypothetical protein